MAKASMPEIFQHIATWLATSGIRVLEILIAFIILSQMSKWEMENEKFLPDLILDFKL